MTGILGFRCVTCGMVQEICEHTTTRLFSRDDIMAENAALRKALGWYADKRTWGLTPHGYVQVSDADKDNGQKAREALRTDGGGGT